MGCGADCFPAETGTGDFVRMPGAAFPATPGGGRACKVKRPGRIIRLGDGQDEGVAGSTAGTAQVGGASAGSGDRYVGSSGSGNHRGCDGDLHLLAAEDLRSELRPVDDYNGGRDQVTAVHGEQETLLHLGERDGVGGERGNGWGRTGASAQRVQCFAALKDQHGEQQCAERPQRSADWFHTASYTGEGGRGLDRGTEVTAEKDEPET